MSFARELAQAATDPNNLAFGAGEALASVALTTVYNHRQLTHDSVELAVPLQHVARGFMAMHGVRSRKWADVHTVHHAVPDANIAPILAVADYHAWREEHPEVTEPPIPSDLTYRNLDPVAELTRDDIKWIAEPARDMLKGRYEAPEGYSEKQAQALIDTETPRYGYDKAPQDPETDIFTPDLRGLLAELRDPHSPALDKRGIGGILLANVARYRAAAAYFRRREETGQVEDSRDKWDERIYDRVTLGPVIGLAANIALQVALGKNLRPRALAIAVVKGTAVTAAEATTYIAGGSITNSLGHAGVRGSTEMIKSGPWAKPVPKPDGTYTSKNRVLSAPTLDEVGGQDAHHADPSAIAYTTAKGWRKVVDAPFGSLIEWCADRGILMRHGKQFGGGLRPDVPVEAVLRLEAARVRTLQAPTTDPSLL